MKKYFKKTIFCLTFLSGFLMCQNAQAADKYVVRGATGTGASWADAMEMPARGSESICNFDVETWTKGDTYWIAGSDMAYGEICFRNTTGSGTITLKKATTDSHGTDTGWSADYGTKQAVLGAIGNQGVSDVVIDGSTGSGRSGYGFKIIGNTGSNSFAISWQSGSTHNNLTVNYAEITSPTEPISDGCIDGNTCTAAGIYLHNVTGASLENLWIHDVALPYHVITPTNFVVKDSIVERNDSTDAHHSEAFSFVGGTNVVINNNDFVDIEGTGVFAFMNYGTANGVKIYNNIIRYTTDATQTGLGNGIFTCTNNNTICNNVEYYNNTQVNPKGINAMIDIGEGGAASTWIVKNNIWWCADGVVCAPASNEVSDQITYDNNWYGGVTYNSSENGAIYQATENPFIDAVNYDFALGANATAINAGTDLSAIFTTDFLGNTRSGVWDIGAYEYVGSADVIAPAAPSGLAVI